MRFILFVLPILVCQLSFSQQQFASHIQYPDSTKFLIKDSVWNLCSEIKAADLKEMVYYLSSDSMEGRELGYPGNDKAAKYISEKFHAAGIQTIPGDNTYFQDVAFSWLSWDELTCKVNNTDYRHLWDFLCLPVQNKDLKIESNEVYFLGYGIDDPQYSDYQHAQVKDKIVLIYNGEPRRENGKYYISNTTIPSRWSSEIELKIAAAKKHGVKLVLIIEDKMKSLVEEHRNSILSPSVIMSGEEDSDQIGANLIHISPNLAIDILGKQQKSVIKCRNKINSTGKSSYKIIKTDIRIVQMINSRSVKGQNIVAYIEGSDKKEEVIVLTAHYDHIGRRGDDIYNGADDNGSGTSAIIEIARTLQYNKNKGIVPRRSILCMLFTGEEKGLLGSKYYVNNPIIPLEQTISNINIDMIGRHDDIYMENNNYIYVIGSDRLSMDLHLANEKVNQTYSGMILDYTYNSETDPNRFYYRSDHYNFAERGVPAIFFFTGVHEDYHRVGDDPEKINYEKMEKITKHIFMLAWELANNEKRISLNTQ